MVHDIIDVMGKVIINRTDADGTARQSDDSLTDSQRGNYPKERAHIDISRAVETADSVGVKVSTKSKSAANATQKGTSDKSAKKTQSDSEVKVKSVQKSAKIKRFAEPEAAEKKKETVKSLPTKTIKVKNVEPKQLGAGEIAPKAETKLVKKSQRSKNKSEGDAKRSGAVIVKHEQLIDPEIALMASRASAMEKTDPALIRIEPDRFHGARNNVASTNVAHAAGKQSESEEEELRFSKMKSALIGIGVTVVVAVIGFAGIALFGNKKPMCTVSFESNGGSQIEGTEVVCGRAIEQPDSPEKEGFTFEGWMLNGDDYNFDEMTIDHNSTLVAKWKAKDGTEIVTVNFDSDGGSNVQKIELAKGKFLNLPNAPTKVGYIFDDWYLDGKAFDISQPITKDITLKAKWEKRPASSNNTNSNQNNSNNSNNNNTHKPSNQVSSMTVQNLTLENGKGTSINVSVLPKSANYSLAIAGNSNPSVASCTVTSSIVTCDAKAVGSTTVRVRDTNSGKFAQFTVTVTAAPKPPVDDKPDVTDPKDDEPTKPDDGKEDPPSEPTNPDDNPGGDDDDGGDDNPGGDDGGDDNPGGGEPEGPEQPGPETPEVSE